MLIDGVKCSKLTHLKHFTLNAVKNFINSFPNISWVNLKLGGAKVTLRGALPSLKSAYASINQLVHDVKEYWTNGLVEKFD